MRLGSWGRAEFGWVHAALELGAREVWMLDGWHAAQELGARGFGWLARGSGAALGGTRLWSWGPAEFGWLARGFGAGGPRRLGGWHAAQELGARGLWSHSMYSYLPIYTIEASRLIAKLETMVVIFSIRATGAFQSAASHTPRPGSAV